MKTSEILTQAKQLISDPDHWTTGWYARDSAGEKIHPTQNGATCFCSMGAVYRVVGHCAQAPESTSAFSALASAIDPQKHNGYYNCIPVFNDFATHKEVMEMWDTAIKLAKEEEEK